MQGRVLVEPTHFIIPNDQESYINLQKRPHITYTFSNFNTLLAFGSDKFLCQPQV
mgnify:CR=1 FL=1